MNHYLKFAVLSLIISTQGCQLIHSDPNVREFIKGNVVLTGTTYSHANDGQPEYFHLRVTGNINDTTFAVELQEGTIIDLQDITVESIKDRSNVNVYTSDTSNAVSYTLNGYRFWFENRKLVQFEATYVKRLQRVPVLFDNTHSQQFLFPLSQTDAEELFGKADEIRNKFVL